MGTRHIQGNLNIKGGLSVSGSSTFDQLTATKDFTIGPNDEVTINEKGIEINGYLYASGYIKAESLRINSEFTVGPSDEIYISETGITINGSPVITEDTLNALPEYSTDNNGQFLRIVDGKPTWSIVPNAEEEKF